MEEWQKQHLNVNRPKLIKETICHELLLSYLLSEGVLADVDLESIRCKTNRFEQASVFYNIVETRENGYMEMVKALGKVSQTGPQKIFMEGYARHATPNLKINFLGKTQTLNETFTKAEIEKIINEIRNHVTLEHYIELYDQSKGENQCLAVLNDTIPAEVPFYIPRSLSRRVNVNPEVFQVDCADVFVFKGVDCSHLAKLVKPQIIAPSTSQLLTLSARFIFLEHDEDWEEISAIAKVPVHLIKHEEKDGGYLLEETSGGSKILYHYLGTKRYDSKLPSDSHGHKPKQANQNGFIKISEEEFLKTATTHGSRGVSICDLPGMGKSQLLANLARKMKQRHPEIFVVFIQLSLFSDVAVKKVGHAGIVDVSVVRNILFEYVTPTPLACILLTALVNNTATHLEVFLDGFDEVRSEHVSVAKKMMTVMANELPNIRVHVTSRPHMRQELEVTLKMISYDILPFSHNDQVNFLTNFWLKMNSKNSKEKLDEFADYCIKMFRKSLSSGRQEFTGIPLRCRLVAEVFARNALIFAKPDRNVSLKDVGKIEASLPDLYQQYMELCFSKIRARVTRSDSTTSILCSPVQHARRLIEAVVGDNACMSDVQPVKDYHVFMALQTLFPELTDVFSKIFTFPEEIDDWNLFSIGMLQKRFTGNSESLEFLHRTFAEFLVAEWFACVLNGELHHVPLTKGVEKKLTQFLFEKMISTTTPDGRPFRFVDAHRPRFIHPVVVHFFNFFCAGINVTNQNKFVNSEFVSCVSGGQLKRLLAAVLFYNYGNVFNLINGILQRMGSVQLIFYKIKLQYCDKAGFTDLLKIAAHHSSLAIIQQLFKFSREHFGVDLDIICKEWNPARYKYNTPLFSSIKRENYEMVQYFADRVPYDTSLILNAMVQLHPFKSQKLKRGLIDIGTMLFERQTNLSRNVKIHIFLGDLRVDAVKLLLKARGTTQSNAERKPLSHISTECMDSEQFKELCRVFIENDRLFFNYEDGEFEWPLPKILCEQNVCEQELETIFGAGHQLSNDDMDQSSNLLMCAAAGRRSLTFLKKMIEAGADVMSKDYKGNTFAHTISRYYTPKEYHEIVQLLIGMQMGNAFQITNEYGETPLHFALERLEVFPQTLQLLAGRVNVSSPSTESKTDMHFNSYVNLNAVNKRGESLLHAAIRGKRTLALIKQLVELGVDWSVKTKRNTNLAHRCSCSGLPDHLKYFVQLGCDINELDIDGDNALQCVIFEASENVMEIAEFLVASGVQKENINKKGKTAFDYAIEKGIKNARLLQLLQC